MNDNSIVENYNSMFTSYGDTWEVSGVSLPTYYWATDEKGDFKTPTVLRNITSDVNANGTEAKIYDIKGKNVYAPFSLFSDYKLFHYSGILGFMYPNDPHNVSKFFDHEQARNNTMWGNLEPTYKNILEQYEGIESAEYKIQDFIYNKYFNKIPTTYLITLRRYPNACDDIPFTLGWDEYVHSQLHPMSVQIPIATATTYMSETAGNKMEDILKFSFGTNWADQESEISVVNGANPGATGFGIGAKIFNAGAGSQRDIGIGNGHFKAGLAAVGTNLFTGTNLTYAQQTTAAAYASMDPWAKFSKFTQGPVDVVKKTKGRAQGLEFDNSYSLKFEYELTSLQFVNPKIAMLDVISNMIMMGTNTGNWWGGATRYYGNGGGYGRQIGDPALFAKGDYAGYFKSVANNVTNSIKSINGGSLPSSLKEVIELAKTIAKGAFSNMIGSLINGNLGQLGAGQPAAALLSGDPTGYWHVTIGNPLNPIAMMGNMICKQIEMNMGQGLGYDDFPVNVTFTCQLEHGKPRDAGDIESMFNAGKGRIYQTPYLGDAYGNDDGGIYPGKFEKMQKVMKQIGEHKDVNHIGENAGMKKSGGGKKFYRSGSTDHPLFDKTIDQITAYTR